MSTRPEDILIAKGYANSDTPAPPPPATMQWSQRAVVASELLPAVFGERSVHERSAVGMAQLPGNASVEIEAIFQRRS